MARPEKDEPSPKEPLRPPAPFAPLPHVASGRFDHFPFPLCVSKQFKGIQGNSSQIVSVFGLRDFGLPSDFGFRDFGFYVCAISASFLHQAFPIRACFAFQDFGIADLFGISHFALRISALFLPHFCAKNQKHDPLNA